MPTKATIARRLANGWTISEAMFGKLKPVTRIVAEARGIVHLYESRIAQGVDPEEACRREKRYRRQPESLLAACQRTGIAASTVYGKAKKENIPIRTALVRLCEGKLKRLEKAGLK
jgi:hypothetical protein